MYAPVAYRKNVQKVKTNFKFGWKRATAGFNWNIFCFDLGWGGALTSCTPLPNTVKHALAR